MCARKKGQCAPVRVHTVVTVHARLAQELALVQGFHVAAGNPVNLSALVKLTSLDLSRSKCVPAWNRLCGSQPLPVTTR